MFVHEQFAQRQVGIELGDVGLGIGDIRGAAEVVTVIEEDVFDVGRVRWEIAIAPGCALSGSSGLFHWMGGPGTSPFALNFGRCTQPSGTEWAAQSFWSAVTLLPLMPQTLLNFCLHRVYLPHAYADKCVVCQIWVSVEFRSLRNTFFRFKTVWPNFSLFLLRTFILINPSI